MCCLWWRLSKNTPCAKPAVGLAAGSAAGFCAESSGSETSCRSSVCPQKKHRQRLKGKGKASFLFHCVRSSSAMLRGPKGLALPHRLRWLLQSPSSCRHWHRVLRGNPLPEQCKFIPQLSCQPLRSCRWLLRGSSTSPSTTLATEQPSSPAHLGHLAWKRAALLVFGISCTDCSSR